MACINVTDFYFLRGVFVESTNGNIHRSHTFRERKAYLLRYFSVSTICSTVVAHACAAASTSLSG